MMICPLCATRVGIETELCPSCGSGLREYAVAAYLPHWLFNEALVRVRREQWAQACTLFAQAGLYLPKDTDLLRGWAYCLAQMGQFDEALDKITTALEIADTQEIREEITDIMAQMTLATAEETPQPPRRPSYFASRTRNPRTRHISHRSIGNKTP